MKLDKTLWNGGSGREEEVEGWWREGEVEGEVKGRDGEVEGVSSVSNGYRTLYHFENERDVTTYFFFFVLELKHTRCCQVAWKYACNYKKVQLKCLHAYRDIHSQSEV